MSTQTSIMPKVMPHFAQKHFNIGIMDTPHKDLEPAFVAQSLEAFCSLGFSVNLTAEGNQDQQKAFFNAEKLYPAQCQILEGGKKDREKLVSLASVALFWDVPSAASLQNLAKEGVIVILPYNESLAGIENFNAQTEKGNVFLYEPGNFWSFMATVIRAFENFKFAYDWNTLKKTWKASEVTQL